MISLRPTYIGKNGGGGDFGQSIWDESVVLLGTYWRTHWELDENPWELDGNTLGIAKTQKNSNPNFRVTIIWHTNLTHIS